jgi:hypothetical protein|tara:strand:+ start:25 stop:246 length:222 start_codon:yes stop_codon:yes gene_type:complete
MSSNPKEEIRIEFPEVHAYQLDKKNNHLYLCLYDNIMEQEYTIMFDTYEFIQWVGSKEIQEMKENLIKTIEKI